MSARRCHVLVSPFAPKWRGWSQSQDVITVGVQGHFWAAGSCLGADGGCWHQTPAARPVIAPSGQRQSCARGAVWSRDAPPSVSSPSLPCAPAIRTLAQDWCSGAKPHRKPPASILGRMGGRVFAQRRGARLLQGGLWVFSPANKVSERLEFEQRNYIYSTSHKPRQKVLSRAESSCRFLSCVINICLIFKKLL